MGTPAAHAAPQVWGLSFLLSSTDSRRQLRGPARKEEGEVGSAMAVTMASWSHTERFCCMRRPAQSLGCTPVPGRLGILSWFREATLLLKVILHINKEGERGY